MADDFDPNNPVFVTMKPPKGVEGRTENGDYPRISREAFEAVFADKGWTEVKDSESASPTVSPVASTPTRDSKN